ncbi:MAG: hypothetical protein J5785_04100 [Spirochaetales bacterium]|nr:hypothetical protein [Spirochaetales bacterium]
MADIVLEATPRLEDFGSAGAGRLRRAGRIPAVIYGKGNHQHVSFEAHAFEMATRGIGKGSKVTVKIGTAELKCQIMEFQEDLIRGKILHVDFKEL